MNPFDVWRHICSRYPAFREIPIHTKRCNSMAYMPPGSPFDWGIWVSENYAERLKDRGYLGWWLEDQLKGTGVAISDEVFTQFCLLHEAGHHYHCADYMKEHDDDGRGWMHEYSDALFKMQCQVEVELSRCGVIDCDYEPELYRQLPFEIIADRFALLKLKEFHNIS